MTNKRRGKIQVSLKNLEVAQKALNHVDLDCLSKDNDDEREYADEMFRQWERAMYAIDDLIGAFSVEEYELDDTD